jgi:hypothetical protein
LGAVDGGWTGCVFGTFGISLLLRLALELGEERPPDDRTDTAIALPGEPDELVPLPAVDLRPM